MSNESHNKTYRVEHISGLTVSSFAREYRSAYCLEPYLRFAKLLHDGPSLGQSPEPFQKSEEKSLVLYGYFNDLYKLFVRKLATFECASDIDDSQAERLKTLLSELIKVKKLISSEAK
jgi:hypothetical protein